jgi:drug/metabolite transporter (DMT)-like permease
MQKIGELAAFGTAVSWTVGALVMESAVRRVGVMAVNVWKVAFGLLYLCGLSFALTGRLFPLDVSPGAWGYIALSSLFGFVIGDYFLFNAYALIGSRLAMLLMSSAVPMTAIGAYLAFGEGLGPWSFIGMALSVCGIALTVLSGKASGGPSESARGRAEVSAAYVKGVAFGLLSGLCMAFATLFTKKGASGVDSLSATQVRIFCALAGFIVFALVTGKAREVTSSVHNGKAFGLMALGGVFGPFVGVGLLLYAIQTAEAGIVSTLSSFTPVLIIPPSMLIHKRRINAGEVVGALIAVAGLALLFI